MIIFFMFLIHRLNKIQIQAFIDQKFFFILTSLIHEELIRPAHLTR